MRPKEQKPACPECDAETDAVITRDRKAMVVNKKREQQAECAKPGGNRSAPTMRLPKVYQPREPAPDSSRSAAQDFFEETWPACIPSQPSRLGSHRQFAAMSGDEVAAVLRRMWG